MPDQMTLQQFGATIKKKYPAYASKSDEEVGRAMLAKYPQYAGKVQSEPFKPTASFTAPSPVTRHNIIPKLTEILPVNSKQSIGTNVGNFIGDIGAGGLNVLLHPIDTATGIVKSFIPGTDTPNPIRATYEGLRTAPAETIAQGIGQTAVMAPIAEATGGALKSIPKVARGATERITGTSPKVTAELAKETTERNAEAVKAAEEKNAEIAAKRKVDLAKHFEKTQQVREGNAAAEAPVARKAALTRGVEKLDPKFKEDLGALRENVHARANAKFVNLNAALDDVEAHPDFLPNAVMEAAEKIKGSNTEPTILKDMEKRLGRGEPVPYRDLQGYYTELGRELQKGTLPGDVYHAYDTLQEAVGNEMQRVADSRGLGPQLADARQTWRQMKQTFYDPKSPVAKALKATERGKSIAAFQGADQSGIAALAKYDPQLAQRANVIRGYQAEAKGLPAKPTGLKSLPKLAERAPEVQPEVQKINAQDVREAKAQGLEKGTERVRKYGHKIVNYGVGLHALWDAFDGRVENLPRDFTLGLAGYGATEAFARLLERPEIRELLTNPTPTDIAQIPPDLRGNLGPMLDAAQKRGIKVSPQLLTAAGVAGGKKKGVARVLRPEEKK